LIIHAARERPTAVQLRKTRAVTAWYFRRYYRTPWDIGTDLTFCDPSKVGAFSVDPAELAAGTGGALFRLLVTVTMFQRRQDRQIFRILTGLSAGDATELSTQPMLLSLSARSPCPHIKSVKALETACDLAKDPRTRGGTCTRRPGTACHLKRHTVLLKRYGHFGKVPTSIALMAAEGGGDLPKLRSRVFAESSDHAVRARRLLVEISRAWRVNEKIGSMFLSLVCVPGISAAPPWRDGIDWTHFVVIDSNVDLFLAYLGYRGRGSYEARRDFIREISRGVDIAAYVPESPAYNPRLVQQAMYLFMSRTNRRASDFDCSADGPARCSSCPRDLRAGCSLRVSRST
jgi:hypothetical protein